METSEVIQVSATMVGILTSITAVVISVLSLKQSQRSIDAANRPYVVVYRDYIQVLGTIHEYIIVKNFGKSGATIDSLTFEPTYTDSMRGKNIFGNISNTFIAPGQSISTVASQITFQGERSGTIEATINYHSGEKHYENKVILNEELLHDLSFSKTNPSKSKSLEEVITKATQEILRKKL